MATRGSHTWHRQLRHQLADVDEFVQIHAGFDHLVDLPNRQLVGSAGDKFVAPYEIADCERGCETPGP